MGSFRKRGLAIFCVSAAVTYAVPAWADDKQACSAAYEQAQSLRKEGKLSTAREQSLVCSREVCPEFIRVDCAAWMAEIEKSQPSLVLQVRDGAGKDITDAIVSLDEQPWTTTIDGKARFVDPGRHTIRVEVAGQLAVEATVVANEGEKNKPVVVTIGGSSSGGSSAAKPTEPPPAAADDSGGSVAPWIIGGVGAASLVVGGVLAIVVAGDKSTMDDNCDEATNICTPEGLDARDSGQTLGPISTIALIAGAVGVGVATVWLISDASGGEPTASAEVPRSLGASPMISTDGGGLRLRGSF